MPSARFIAIAICAVVLLAVPAAAKEGVRAKLEGTVQLGAAPGKKIRITWRLIGADGHAFGASGIYLRVSRCGGGAHRVNARNLGGGRFSARVVVPTARIRTVGVGLMGWRTADGKTRRADVFFAFDPPLARRCGY